MDKKNLNWKILAYLKNATEETVENIKTIDDREDLIEEVLKLRNQNRAELVCKKILENDPESED